MTLPRPQSTTPPSSRHLLRGPLAALASLQLAVVLIGLYAVVVAWGTFVERQYTAFAVNFSIPEPGRYGAAAARFGVYDSVWFTAVNALLGANVLCSMLIRFPWRRRQTGFVVTHTGILVLLLGCLVSQRSGVEAHLSIFEGRAGYRAFKESYHFELRVAPAEPSPSAVAEIISVPFVPGPFSWKRYAELSWFPWHCAFRSRGTLLDEDGIRLDLLDYRTVDLLDYRAEPQPSAGVRLTVDGAAQRLTLVASTEELPRGSQPKIVQGKDRRVAISLVADRVDLGFQVYLHKFQRKLDPGSEMASHFSSLVDFLGRDEPPSMLQENVLITLNAPVDIADPSTGRTYRLFQSSYVAPDTPGYSDLLRQAAKDSIRDQPYQTILSVNYDPGRGLKYFGSLLIVAGIVIVYCLRGYFVRRERTDAVSAG